MCTVNKLLAMVYDLARLAMEAVRVARSAIVEYDAKQTLSINNIKTGARELAERIDSAGFELTDESKSTDSEQRAPGAIVRIAPELIRVIELASDLVSMTSGTGEPFKPPEQIAKMADRVADMLDSIMSSVAKHDLHEAESIFAMDDAVDDLVREVFSDMTEGVVEKRISAVDANRAISAAQTLERAGEHLTSAAEQICYMISGKRTSESEYRMPVYYAKRDLPPEDESSE